MQPKLSIVILIFVFLTGCSDHQDREKLSMQDKNQKILAQINNRLISQDEFNAYVSFKRIPENDEKQMKNSLRQYVEREALAESICQTDILDMEKIKVELNEFRKEMLISRYFEKYLSNKVTNSSIKKYYQNNAEKFEFLKAHAAHILIRTRKNMSDIEKQSCLTTAHEAYSKIRSGNNFSDIARHYSEDKLSAEKGGDLGWIKKGYIDKRLSEILFELKPGEISEPIETKFGFHIVKLIESPRKAKQSFETVSGDIRYRLRMEARQEEMKRLRSTIKQNIRYVTNEKE